MLVRVKNYLIFGSSLKNDLCYDDIENYLETQPVRVFYDGMNGKDHFVGLILHEGSSDGGYYYDEIKEYSVNELIDMQLKMLQNEIYFKFSENPANLKIISFTEYS